MVGTGGTCGVTIPAADANGTPVPCESNLFCDDESKKCTECGDNCATCTETGDAKCKTCDEGATFGDGEITSSTGAACTACTTL